MDGRTEIEIDLLNFTLHVDGRDLLAEHHHAIGL
ncbi:phage major tail tube protein [Pseudomonas taiwanensis]